MRYEFYDAPWFCTVIPSFSKIGHHVTYIGYDYEVTWDGNFKRFSCLSLYNTDTYQDRQAKV